MATEQPTTNAAEKPHTKESTAVTKYGAETARQALSTILGSVGQPAIHNFVGDSMDQWRMTAIARGPNCGDMKSIEGQEFKLVHFYIHPVQIPGQTPGEFIDSIRCVLFNDKLEPVAFVSEGIAQSLATILDHCGIGPWSPPLLIRVISSKTSRNRNIYSIVPA